MRLRVLLGIACAVAMPFGWLASDAVERDDDFCNACHLSPGVPLHIETRRDFDGRPPRSLAAAHAAHEVGASPIDRILMQPDDRPMRCIDCHAGTGAGGRAEVKVLAAKDAFFWAIGRFEEPSGMTHPLSDADCRRCHTAFAPPEDEYADPGFHDLGVHNAELGVSCVECHTVHERDVDARVSFLHPRRVRAQCARCHTEFEEG